MDEKVLLQQVAELQQQVEEIRGLEEVRQLTYHYLNCLALTKWDELLECFAPDVRMELSDAWHEDKIVLNGLTEVKERFVNQISQGHHGTDAPYVVHPIVRKEGEIIKGNFMLYWMWSYQRTGQMLFWQQLIYDNDYAKVDGKWKISVLRLFGRLGPPTGMEPPFLGT